MPSFGYDDDVCTMEVSLLTVSIVHLSLAESRPTLWI